MNRINPPVQVLLHFWIVHEHEVVVLHDVEDSENFATAVFVLRLFENVLMLSVNFLQFQLINLLKPLIFIIFEEFD